MKMGIESFSAYSPEAEKSSVEKAVELIEPAEIEKLLDSLENENDFVKATAETTLERIADSELSDSRKSLLVEKLIGSVKRTVKVFSFATALCAATGAVNHMATRHEVSMKTGADSKVEYVHEDSQTTHVINVMSGKEQLTEEDRVAYLKGYLHWLLRGDMPASSFYDKASLEELAILAQQAHPERFKTPEDVLAVVPTAPQFDPQLYEALWKLEKETGSPKVGFRFSQGHGLGTQLSSEYIKKHESFYDPSSNAVLLGFSDEYLLEDTFVAELAHAKQFNEKPVSSSLRGAKDFLSKVGVALLDKDLNFDEAYGQLYDEEGSLEHEAHSVIEPALADRLVDMTPERRERYESYVHESREIVDAYRAEIESIDNWFYRLPSENVMSEVYREARKEYTKRHSEAEADYEAKREALRLKYPLGSI